MHNSKIQKLCIIIHKYPLKAPENVNWEVLLAIYTILNEMITSYPSKLAILVPAVISVIKVYLELIDKIEKKDIALQYLKRLFKFIHQNKDVKLKLGVPTGFLFPNFVKIHFSFPGTERISSINRQNSFEFVHYVNHTGTHLLVILGFISIYRPSCPIYHIFKKHIDILDRFDWFDCVLFLFRNFSMIFIKFRWWTG